MSLRSEFEAFQQHIVDRISAYFRKSNSRYSYILERFHGIEDRLYTLENERNPNMIKAMQDMVKKDQEQSEGVKIGQYYRYNEGDVIWKVVAIKGDTICLESAWECKGYLALVSHSDLQGRFYKLLRGYHE